MPYLSIPTTTYAYSSPVGIEGYIKTLSPLISSLPGCKEVLKSGMKDMFSKIKGAFSSSGSSDTENTNINDAADTDTLGEEQQAIEIYNKGLETNIKGTKASSAETEKQTSSINKNKTCLDGIGKAVAKILLNEMTKSMVEWINGGMDGTPKFVHDPAAFFGDIAKNEVLQFGLEINNPALFPFGKDFIKMQKDAFVKHFSDNAKYSLDQAIGATNPGKTGADFKLNFSDGGWGAWTAMTQNTANNPIGFNIAASNELSMRLNGTQQTTADKYKDQIATANGYLNQERCAEEAVVDDTDGSVHLETNHDITRGEDNQYLRGVEGARHCATWETVTPGKLISESATKTLNFRSDSLLSVGDLNDATAALIDATLSMIATKIAGSDGFTGLSEDPNGTSNSFDLNGGSSLASQSQTDQDFPASLGGSNWLTANPDFNIRTDITQALIDEQRIYIQKLQDQNTELKSVKNVNNTNYNYGLLPIIYQLDYCIPGPHPGWEDEAQRNLDDAKSKIVDIGGMNFAQINRATGVGSSADWDVMFLAFNTFVLGTGGIANYETVDKALHLTDKYSYQYLDGFSQKYLGISFTKDGASESYKNTIGALNQAFDGYKQSVNNVFNTLTLPGVADQAKKEFNTATGYQGIFDKNTTEIAGKQADIKRLVDIKSAIENLTIQKNNQTLPLTMIDPITNSVTTDYNAQFEEDLKPYISTFARVSANMVTGDDIAKADNLLQQIKDKEKYIYNDLIKGPTGCEKELSTQPWQMKRYPYPLPIIYDYNSTTNPLPDPFGNGIFHTTPVLNPSVYTASSMPSTAGMIWVDFSGVKENPPPNLPMFDGEQDHYNGPGSLQTLTSFCQYIAEKSRLTQPGVAYSSCNEVGSNFTNIHIGELNFDTGWSQGTQYNVTTLERTLGIY